MEPTAVRARAADLPPDPGVYLFLARTSAGRPDAAGDTGRNGEKRPATNRLETAASSEGERVLYVGKAVDLADRVVTYADPRGRRIRQMVQRADAIEVAVTATETQALLLEANLIKRHQPRYNVRLKDDKSYPLVQLTAHDAPRIEITRDPDDDATVYGPFTDKGRLDTVVKALRETYGLRGCSDHKYAGRDRPCLDYDIGLCTAPCTGEIDPAAYEDAVASVRRFFAGETGVLADPLADAMDAAAAEHRYERAANLRDRLGAVESFHGGGEAAVAAPGANERRVDVLGVALAGSGATVARLHAEDGQLVERERHRVDAPDGEALLDIPTTTASAAPGTDEAPSEEGTIVGAFIAQYYAERFFPDAILCSHRPVDDELYRWLDGEGVDLAVPGTGREATLVDLALKNARQRTGGVDESAALAEALGLDRCRRVEGFDVSHAGGRDVVGSNVVFVAGSAEKQDYRRKKLPEDNDDYANMAALLAWRAERAVAGRDDRPDPDLLLVDGGRAQLDAAREACGAHEWGVPTVALAKADERVITPDGDAGWDADAPQTRLLRRVRDEAHRFAGQYHETLRDEVATVLEDLDGVGPATRRRLLRRFGSVDGVRAASETELRQVEGVGTARAERIDRQLGTGTS